MERYPTDTQYDLVACYCRTSSDCSDILQLLEPLAKKSDSSASAQNSEKAAKSEKVWSCVFICIYCYCTTYCVKLKSCVNGLIVIFVQMHTVDAR